MATITLTAFATTSSVAFVTAASAATGISLNGWEMAVGLFAGLAFFLMGMDLLADSLKKIAGDQMRQVLERFTSNRLTAAVTGTAVTAVVQSSSVTTVLAVGFGAAGVMTLSQAVGVIMGANVGTTMTAQIVAFNVQAWAPVMLALGFFTKTLVRVERVKHGGSALLGLGLVFLGMGVMSDAMAPLRSYQPFVDLMRLLADKTLLAIAISALFTALVQSSSATTGIIVVMASQGLVSLEAGIAMALGANIGTFATAVLAAAGKPVEARRAAAVHVIFNVAGALIWLPIIDQLADIARAVSPSFPELTGTARLAAEAPRQIANANTAFNLINMALFLFIPGLIARLATRLVPERAPDPRAPVTPKFIDEALFATPALALNAARQEIARMGEHALEILDLMQDGVMQSDPVKIRAARGLYQRTHALYPQVLDYLSRLSTAEISESEASELQALILASNEINMLSEILSDRLLSKLEGDALPKPQKTYSDGLHQIYDLLRASVQDAILAIRDKDAEAAARVISAKPLAERVSFQMAQAHATSNSPEDQERLRHELNLGQTLRVLFMTARRAAQAARVDSSTR
ncbi:Na/Pi cotransporter family protein [Tropicimonas sp. S265A]|uniref:Na/Pi cotransporter family protein n=1 Tax=Tropicimonas sp. S265A TaxID=3415134 RepID=UPI003C7B75F3